MRKLLSLWLALAAAHVTGCGSAPPEPAGRRREQPAEYYERGQVVLGSPRLTSGIPGEGPATIAEISSWLADARNHQPLNFILPEHLRAAAAEIEIPADNPLTRAKIELGRQLFFDRRLGAMSCADCHQPRQAYSAFQVFPDTELNPLPAFNRILGRSHFWDGKAATLEDQPLFPVKNIFEMNTTPDKLVEVVAGIEGYRIQFERIFGEVSFEAISKAVASFQRALVAGPSAWDLHRLLQSASRGTTAGKEEDARLQELRRRAAANPMSKSALRGGRLFFSERTRCSRCHSGVNFSDEEFHNLGVRWGRRKASAGRYRVTSREEHQGAFKTPTLRNVARTPPYMHDGSIEKLEQVVEFFNRGCNPNPHLSAEIKPLHLSVHEKRELVAFLKSLNSPLPPVEQGRLPE